MYKAEVSCYYWVCMWRGDGVIWLQLLVVWLLWLTPLGGVSVLSVMTSANVPLMSYYNHIPYHCLIWLSSCYFYNSITVIGTRKVPCHSTLLVWKDTILRTSTAIMKFLNQFFMFWLVYNIILATCTWIV